MTFAVAVLALVAAVVWMVMGAPTTKNFEVVVELEADGRQFAGTAVWQTKASSNFNPLGNGMRYRYETRGEAVAIPISDSVTAFAVLRERGADIGSWTFGNLPADCGMFSPDQLAKFSSGCAVKSPPEIMLAIEEGNQVPTLVPLDKYDGRQGAISLVEIVVRGTDDPVSTGIEARYPWISKLPDGYRISRTTGRRVAAFFKGVIYRADFSRSDD